MIPTMMSWMTPPDIAVLSRWSTRLLGLSSQIPLRDSASNARIPVQVNLVRLAIAKVSADNAFLISIRDFQTYSRQPSRDWGWRRNDQLNRCFHEGYDCWVGDCYCTPLKLPPQGTAKDARLLECSYYSLTYYLTRWSPDLSWWPDGSRRRSRSSSNYPSL